MTRLRYDGLSTTLGADLTATAITFAAPLTYAGGTPVPTIGSGDYIPLSIMTSAGRLAEIVYLTAYTAGATTGTVTRGQEGTSSATRAATARVVHAPTVRDLVGVESGRVAGTGSPEGVVAAPVGTEYIDRSATNGAVTWIKVSGTGSTGWRVSYGDTGWRYVGGLLVDFELTDVVLAEARMRRQNAMVTIVMRARLKAAATAGGFRWSGRPVVQMPAGFQGQSYTSLGAAAIGGEPGLVTAAFDPGVLYAVVGDSTTLWGAGDPIDFQVSYHTGNDWPAVLPGTAI